MRKCLIINVLVVAVSMVAQSDVITLTNGDRLTGTLGALQEGVVKVTTELAGEVAIPWANVSGIESAAPLAVRNTDGAVLEGQLVVTDGSQFVKSGETLQPLALPQVQAIGASAEAVAAAPAAEEPKPVIWSGAIDLGASWRAGTRSTVDARSTVTATREKPKNKLTLMMDAAYAEDEDVANKQSIKGEAKWQFFPKERFYYYGLAGAEHDVIRKLEIRLNGAIGLGYVFVKNETRTFSADAGIDYAYERWELYNDVEKDARRNEIRAAALAQLQTVGQSIFGGTFQPNLRTIWGAGQSVGLLYDPGIDNDIETKNNVSLRLSSHYEQKLFEKGQIIDDLTLLPEFEDVGEFRLTNNLAFTTPLSETLSLKLAVKSEYDSDPGETVSKWDHLFTTGVQYKF